MSVLRKSSVYSCLLLYRRIHHAGRVCRIPCGSHKYSSHPRFKSLIAPSFLFSSVDMQQRNACNDRNVSTLDSPCFQDFISFRQKQAQCSVLIAIASKKDIPYVLNLCESYGEVKNMITFFSKSSRFQVIAEFVQEGSVVKFLQDSSLNNVTEVFPCHSRCLYFFNKEKQKSSAKTLSDMIDLSCETKSSCIEEPSSVSEMVTKLYEKDKMSDLSTRLRFLSSVIVKDSLKGLFPSCAIFPFGSSVNGFGTNNSDLDLMLRLFPEHVSKNPELFFHNKRMEGNSRDVQRRTIYVLGDILNCFIPGVSQVRRVANARVPIVEFFHSLLNLDCDISVNNMSAVYMSEILYFCGELDPRVRPLMYTIKKWAQQASVTSDIPGTQITNFSLTLLLVFFLQSRPIPVLPPLMKVIRIPFPDDHRSHAIEYLNRAGTKILKPALIGKNTESLGELLHGFMTFVADCPFNKKRISILAGSASSRSGESGILIDYPLDESLNVSKNVSQEKILGLHKAAHDAAKNLEKNLGTALKSTDLMSILCGSDSSPRIDVNDFFVQTPDSVKVKTSIR